MHDSKEKRRKISGENEEKVHDDIEERIRLMKRRGRRK